MSRHKRNRFCGKSLTGQVTVELLLVLPVFFLLIFLIMEVGYLAFKVILYHHSAYELARIGSLVAGPRGGVKSSSSKKDFAKTKMDDVLQTMGIVGKECVLDAGIEETLEDPQVKATDSGYHMNEDLLVTLSCNARLIFPGARYVLSDAPKSKGIKKINVTVMMPIEKPIFQ